MSGSLCTREYVHVPEVADAAEIAVVDETLAAVVTVPEITVAGVDCTVKVAVVGEKAGAPLDAAVDADTVVVEGVIAISDSDVVDVIVEIAATVATSVADIKSENEE